jgi:hypothetical protein
VDEPEARLATQCRTQIVPSVADKLIKDPPATGAAGWPTPITVQVQITKLHCEVGYEEVAAFIAAVVLLRFERRYCVECLL